MSGSSSDPAPGSSGSIPPAGPPPAASWYPTFYPPPPPPKRSNLALIIVIVVVVVVLVPVILAAVLYILVSGLMQAPNSPPIVAFGFVDQTGGNATIHVSSSREIDPSSIQVRLSANSSGSSTGMPPPGGSVALIVGGYTLRLFWLDEDNDQVFGTSDAFRITGNSARLPSSTMFSLELSLVTSSGQTTSWVTWTTA